MLSHFSLSQNNDMIISHPKTPKLLARVTRAFSDWPVKKRLSMIGGLMFGMILVTGLSHEIEILLNRQVDSQVNIAQQQLQLSETLGQTIDVAHSRMLNYLYMGGEINRDISLTNAKLAITTLHQLASLDHSKVLMNHAIVTLDDRLDALMIQLKQSANELKYSQPMSEDVLGSIVDLNMIENACDQAREGLVALLRANVTTLQYDANQLMMIIGALFWGAMILGVILVVSCVYCISISILHPLEILTTAIAQMGRGKYNFSLSYLLQGGEIGQLIESVEKTKEDNQQSHIVFQMTEQMPYAIMMANRTTLNIEYLNQSALDLFTGLEEFLPCSAKDILGNSMDIFHQHPEHQRKMIKNKDAFPLNATFHIGGQHIAFSAVAIDNVEGEWSHIMVCWENVSEQEEFQETIHDKMKNLSSRARSCRKGTDEIGQIAHLSNTIATSVGVSAQSSAEGVSTVTEGIKELASSFQRVTDQLAETKSIADQASMEVSSAQFAFFELETAAEEIGCVVQSIEKIAANIRTLSMNATIEAARAGEFGSGFSVVAREVRDLAKDAAKATQSAKESVATLNNNLSESSNSFRQVGDAMERLDTIASELEETAHEQGVATAQIADHATDIDNNVQMISQEIQRVVEQTEETEASVKKIVTDMRNMQNESGELDSHIAQFVEKMRQV